MPGSVWLKAYIDSRYDIYYQLSCAGNMQHFKSQCSEIVFYNKVNMITVMISSGSHTQYPSCGRPTLQVRGGGGGGGWVYKGPSAHRRSN